jgi:hypothetical protein
MSIPESLIVSSCILLLEEPENRQIPLPQFEAVLE